MAGNSDTIEAAQLVGLYFQLLRIDTQDRIYKDDLLERPWAVVVPDALDLAYSFHAGFRLADVVARIARLARGERPAETGVYEKIDAEALFAREAIAEVLAGNPEGRYRWIAMRTYRSGTEIHSVQLNHLKAPTLLRVVVSALGKVKAHFDGEGRHLWDKLPVFQGVTNARRWANWLIGRRDRVSVLAWLHDAEDHELDVIAEI